MLRRYNLLLFIGVAVFVLGGAIFLNLFPGEPMWAEWLLGPIVAFVGIVSAIVAVALRCYAVESANDSV